MSSARVLALVAVSLLLSALAHAGATVTIIPGAGFSDSTPATPVGGNTGTTVGAQRLIAFQYAANIWGATLDSNVEIRVNAQFSALTCTQNSGTLGSAGATQILRDFPNAALANTWYVVALASKQAGSDRLPGTDDITANFNSSINNDPNCLNGATWYYGLDNNHSASQVNLVAVVLHELAHGLGFAASGTTLETGQQAQGFPSAYTRRLFDVTVGKFWHEMTDNERLNSAINNGNVVWRGEAVLAAAPNVLSGTPQVTISAPPAIAGAYGVGTAAFGPALTSPGVSGQLVIANDSADSGSTTDGCATITNVGTVSGKIAVVDRGQCTFKLKSKNVQDAGGTAVIIVNNVAGAPPGMADDANTPTTIVIPVVSVTQTDGDNIKAQIGSTTVNGSVGLNLSMLAGADSQGRPKMNAPNPLQQGSSISHWDPSAFPNQLMEPNINDDLTHSVKAPQDLSRALFTDIGWGAETTGPPPAPTAAFLPSPLAFGNKLLGYGTFTGTVKLSNTGNANMTVSSIDLTGNAAFARSHDCPGTLAAQTFCTITVTYLPPGAGLHSATLTVTTNAAGSPHTVNVTGTGVTDLSFALTRPARPPRAGTGSANVFDLAITPSAGFSGLVELSCDAGAGLRCAVAPNRVQLQGDTAMARLTVEPSRSLRLRRVATAEPGVVRLRAVVEGRVRVVELPVTIGR